jgi:integrase
MAGHIQDRWWRDALDEKGEPRLNAKGKPIREKTELYGKGLRYKVRYYDADNRERNKSFPDKQLSRAQGFLTSMQHDVLTGTYLDPDKGKIVFREYAGLVLMGRSQDDVTQDTLKSRLENQIYPYLGNKPVEKITIDVIRKWMTWLNNRDKPLASGYQRSLFELLSSIMDAAVRDSRIRTNPCQDKSLYRPQRSAEKVLPWPESRMRRVQLALPARYMIATTLGAGLGLRQGEIFAFSMDNVDRDKMIYRCARQLVTLDGVKKFKLPKGHKPREVPLGSGVLDELDAYAENFPPVTITLPWAERDARNTETINVLMTSDEGDMFTRQWFNKMVWRPAFEQAGLQYRFNGEDGMHALRHLYASYLLSQGVSIKELAAFLGHADEGFTLRTYVHLMANSFDRARSAVDMLFKPHGGQPSEDSGAS